jgi:plastocyanin
MVHDRSLPALALSLAFTLAACAGGTAGGTSQGAGTASATRCLAQAGLTGKVNAHGAAQVTGSSVQLQAGDFFFAPTCLTVRGGQAVTVTVKNDGQMLHNLTVTALGIDQDVAAGQSITVTIAFKGSGPVDFFCKYHVASGMQGAFVQA